MRNTPRCSPLARGTIQGTCLQQADVELLKKEYNATHSDSLSETVPVQILSKLKEKQSCKDDLCLTTRVQNTAVRQSLLKTRYSPFMPANWKKNINEWLSSSDIVNVLRQYEASFPAFKFLGPSPTDYYFMETKTQCVWQDLCHFDLQKYLADGKTKFGVVFNIDPHDLPGSHWVAVFINAKTRQIYYFDSTGDKIHKDILRFIREVQAKSRVLGQEYKFNEDTDQTHPLEHQYGDTECGMYVLYFIITMLRNQKDVYQSIFKNPSRKIPDKAMERLRYEYFNERETPAVTAKMNTQVQQQASKYARVSGTRRKRQKHFPRRKA